jgi:cytochrome c oxidase subunit 2
VPSISIVRAAAAIGIALATSALPARASEPVHEVQVVAQKYSFQPAEIRVIAGEPVRLVIRSADSVHGFAIRGLNIDVQVPRGGAAVIAEFTAPPAGRYEIACSEYCGLGHRRMKAALVSVAPVRPTP